MRFIVGFAVGLLVAAVWQRRPSFPPQPADYDPYAVPFGMPTTRPDGHGWYTPTTASTIPPWMRH